ncbi:metal-sensing transcriptional repressor [uncultured Veillonella sp.]|uniref:metal-sensing transcriptional repressor n=1 Tax=uncultured Veillonella sp. TaxID=159268 RepID=UPI0025D2F1B6|nr:metal-sensing transcriptional repressor [uncultured Veillonella sp.]
MKEKKQARTMGVTDGHSNEHTERRAHEHTHSVTTEHNQAHEHTHDGAHKHTHGVTMEHSHEHLHHHVHEQASDSNDGHSHGHTHSHTQTKAVLNRLSRIIGHLESVKRMVEQGRDCSEVLVQLAAVDSAVKGVSRVVMKDHIEHCLVEAVKQNDHETLAKLNEAIDRFIK